MPSGTFAVHDQDDASIERTIGGRYALYGPIASGGMATVHFGRQLGAAGFARTVAIKRLRGEYLESHEFISTLLDEARLASRIRHPNVVATMDMVAAEDELFLVMEYVVGESLSRLLNKLHKRKQRVDPKLATGMMCGVLHALHAAHEATDERGEPLGIVHRDVSPQNILVGVDGLARLLDFGIATGKGRLQTTRAGQLKGKVGYMAPEQILGEDPDRRSDVYAASVVLWEVLTGRRLFETSNDAAANFTLIPKILEADIEPPSRVADVPRVFDGIVMRGLNRERDARYPTARDFAVALEDLVGVATNRQIGEWVEQVAAKQLVARAAQVQRLEALTTHTDRRAVARIADDTVKRRRRKRLGSRDDEDDQLRTLEEEDGLAAALDPPTEIEDEESDTSTNPLVDEDSDTSTNPRLLEDPPTEVDDDEDLKATRVSMREAAARAKAMAQAKHGKEDLRRTTKWRREDVEVADPGPVHVDDEASEDDATIHSDGPRPSDYRPQSVRHSSAPPSVGRESLELPVRSNRPFVVALVIAAMAAAIAAVIKMMR